MECCNLTKQGIIKFFRISLLLIILSIERIFLDTSYVPAVSFIFITGFTPLHYAIAGGNTNGVAILLNKELRMKDHKVPDNNEIKIMVNNHSVDVTPLHLAVSKIYNLSLNYVSYSFLFRLN